MQRASVLDEVEELKRALDCKEKERLQLSLQVKVCIGESVRRGHFMPFEESFSVSSLSF